MHTFSSFHCLELMGIQIWRQSRIFSNTDPLDFEAYGLCGASNVCVGILCLESLPIKAEQEAPLFRLLDAMLSAVKLKRVPLLDDNTLENGRLVLLMGQSLSQKALDSQEMLDTLRAGNLYTHATGAKMLVTYHPLDLLIDPAKKAKAWDDLKKLVVLS